MKYGENTPEAMRARQGSKAGGHSHQVGKVGLKGLPNSPSGVGGGGSTEGTENSFASRPKPSIFARQKSAAGKNLLGNRSPSMTSGSSIGGSMTSTGHGQGSATGRSSVTSLSSHDGDRNNSQNSNDSNSGASPVSSHEARASISSSSPGNSPSLTSITLNTRTPGLRSGDVAVAISPSHPGGNSHSHSHSKASTTDRLSGRESDGDLRIGHLPVIPGSISQREQTTESAILLAEASSPTSTTLQPSSPSVPSPSPSPSPPPPPPPLPDEGDA